MHAKLNINQTMTSVVSEFEGILLRDKDPFSYFMLVAFEASGLIRFTLLLLMWPIIQVLGMLGMRDIGLRLAIFISTAGVHISEIESVARAVLPKFYMDDIDMDAWRVFSSYEKRVVVTKMPKVMVDMFVKDHLKANGVVGDELLVNRFGYATGLVRNNGSVTDRVAALFDDISPSMALSRSSSFLPICQVRTYYKPELCTLWEQNTVYITLDNLIHIISFAELIFTKIILFNNLNKLLM